MHEHNNRQSLAIAPAARQSPPQVSIVGAPIHCVDFTETLAQIGEAIHVAQNAKGTPHHVFQICTVNPEFVVDAWRSPEFGAVLHAADLCVPDGIGILLAARLQNIHLHERVTGSDGIYHICGQAATAGWRVFLLGAAAGVAERAARSLQKLYPGLQVVGTYSGSPAPADWPTIRALLRQTQPDILFVAYGHPAQDIWINAHRDELPTTIAIGVGGAFDFVAGTAKRAPQWMRKIGLEWLYRLVRQPWRWRRMSKLPLFLVLVIVERLQQHRAQKSPDRQG